MGDPFANLPGGAGGDVGNATGVGAGGALPDPNSGIYNPYGGGWGNSNNPYWQNQVLGPGGLPIQLPINYGDLPGPPVQPARLGSNSASVAAAAAAASSGSATGLLATVETLLGTPIFSGSSITWAWVLLALGLFWLIR